MLIEAKVELTVTLTVTVKLPTANDDKRPLRAVENEAEREARRILQEIKRPDGVVNKGCFQVGRVEMALVQGGEETGSAD